MKKAIMASAFVVICAAPSAFANGNPGVATKISCIDSTQGSRAKFDVQFNNQWIDESNRVYQSQLTDAAGNSLFENFKPRSCSVRVIGLYPNRLEDAPTDVNCDGWLKFKVNYDATQATVDLWDGNARHKVTFKASDCSWRQDAKADHY